MDTEHDVAGAGEGVTSSEMTSSAMEESNRRWGADVLQRILLDEVPCAGMCALWVVCEHFRLWWLPVFMDEIEWGLW